ncbi:hypothetical protein [Sphingomonas koreensis]|uniref:hypothetical protein n=1 Tax=Sphingomonas koreensis TaxID=93064 RepID=UPI000F7ECFD8|nr:hypothetical protein [Sphingomonas koreensis]MDC7808778.1 hypothetical protein [Sphingomonas koreensis]RSU98919.1 hypothetical protein CA256_03040 [Sphingomonas koreensis]
MSLLILLAILAGAILFGIWLERRGQRQVLILEVPSGATLEHAEEVADAIVDAFEDAGLRKPKIIVARNARITALAPGQSGPDTGRKA